MRIAVPSPLAGEGGEISQHKNMGEGSASQDSFYFAKKF
jgi:hypothetical protein